MSEEKLGELLSSEQAYSGRLLKLDRQRVRLPNGRETELEIIRHPGASAVVPFLDADTVLMVRQYRHAVESYLYEVPAGTLDPGESPDVCARREVEEEVGHRPGRLAPLGSILTTPGFTDERIHLYAAYDLVATESRLDDDEVLAPVRMSRAEILRRIEDGTIVDAKSLCALLRALA